MSNYTIASLVDGSKFTIFEYSNQTVNAIADYMDVYLNSNDDNKQSLLDNSSYLIIKYLIKDYLDISQYSEEILGILDKHKILIVNYPNGINVEDLQNPESGDVYIMKIYYRVGQGYEWRGDYDVRLETVPKRD